ncbi:MAG: DUF1015 family protein [Planctomycetota bacterium]
MTQIAGLTGHIPSSAAVVRVTAPPYDVIREGSPLEALLKSEPDNLWHVTLGPDPLGSLKRLTNGSFKPLDKPHFIVYEQRWQSAKGAQSRIGVFAAVEVSDYPAGQVIRHEKVFDEKVQGRLKLTKQTGVTLEPVFLLTRSPITPVLHKIASSHKPDYDFISDFKGLNDLDGIASRIFLVPESSPDGQQLQRLVGQNPLYIADGHHRYHAALLGGQSHCLAYVVERAAIQAYNRLVTGVKLFTEIKAQLQLTPATWDTPPHREFRIYHKSGCFALKAKTVPTDPRGSLDCAILERELYPVLGLTHAMIKDPKHFDYYAEWELAKMKEAVDAGKYDLAIALHPVSIAELMAVADAGRSNPDIVMPEKSTFFAPKILSGLVLYRHSARAAGR